MEIIRSKLLGGLAEGPVEVAVRPEEFAVVRQVLGALCAKDDIVDPKIIDRSFDGHQSADALRFRATAAAFFRLAGLAGLLERGAQRTTQDLHITTKNMTPTQFNQHQKRYPAAVVYSSNPRRSV